MLRATAGGLRLFGDGFLRDVAVLIIVSILVGSGLAYGISWAIDNHFGDTVTGLIGKFGEYDFVIHIRQDVAKQALQQTKHILDQELPGSKVTQGVSVAGKANLFVSLSPEYRNRDVMEHIYSYFSGVPGYSAHTIMIEPSIFVGGIEGGLRDRLIRQFEGVPGVKFAFSTGNSIGVVLNSLDETQRIRPALQAIVDQYRILEARLPMNYQGTDLMNMGREIADRLRKADPTLTVAEDITMSQSDDDFGSMARALVEMKRFLTSYASQVTVDLSGGGQAAAELAPGEQLVLEAANPAARQSEGPGDSVRDNSVMVQITDVDAAKRTARGYIVQGDGAALSSTSVMGYAVVKGNRVGELVGATTIFNDRYQLVYAIDESVRLLRQLQALSRDADTAAGHVDQTLVAVDGTLKNIGAVKGALLKVSDGLQGPLTRLEDVDVTGLVDALRRTSDSISQVVDQLGRASYAQRKTVPAVKDLDAYKADLDRQIAAAPPGSALQQRLLGLRDSITRAEEATTQKAAGVDDLLTRLNPVAGQLLSWQDKIDSLTKQVENFRSLASNSGVVKSLFEGLQNVTMGAIDTLSGIDTDAMRKDLANITQRLDAIQKINVDVVINEMLKVKTSLPALSDEDIGRSVRLIDRYLGGEVIPGQQVEVLVDASVKRAAAEQIAREVTGTPGAAVVFVPAGSVQPDMRGELFRLLGEVRSTIAAMVAIVVTLLLLLLDHASVMSVLRALRRSRMTTPPPLPEVPQAGEAALWRRLWAGALIWSRKVWRFAARRLVPGIEYGYGTLVGAALLGTMFLLTRATLPVLSRWYSLLIGAALGLLLALLCERVSPVDVEEVQAGESLGLSYQHIMREIVIPEGRPGLLVALNRRLLRFRGRGESRRARARRERQERQERSEQEVGQHA